MGTYQILPVTTADIPSLVTISSDSFRDDRHTRMKMYEKGTEDMSSEMPSGDYLLAILKKSDVVKIMKAVDERGTIVGFTSWRMWNFDGEFDGVRRLSCVDRLARY